MKLITGYMKATILIALALLSTATLLFSCKSKTSETAATTENPAAAETATPKGKYAIKSGIVEYKTQVMGKVGSYYSLVSAAFKYNQNLDWGNQFIGY